MSIIIPAISVVVGLITFPVTFITMISLFNKIVDMSIISSNKAEFDLLVLFLCGGSIIISTIVSIGIYRWLRLKTT